jgi:mitochondrial chaperone BCS1
VLDPGIKDLLIDDAKDFLESKQWYSERGIPFRRGYLLVRSTTDFPSD